MKFSFVGFLNALSLKKKKVKKGSFALGLGRVGFRIILHDEFQNNFKHRTAEMDFPTQEPRRFSEYYHLR